MSETRPADPRDPGRRWAVEDPAVARVAFAAGRTEPAARISPHPHDVLGAELDRLVGAGTLPASARPGAEFVIWAAMHGLAVLVADGLVRLDSSPASTAKPSE